MKRTRLFYTSVATIALAAGATMTWGNSGRALFSNATTGQSYPAEINAGTLGTPDGGVKVTLVGAQPQAGDFLRAAMAARTQLTTATQTRTSSSSSSSSATQYQTSTRTNTATQSNSQTQSNSETLTNTATGTHSFNFGTVTHSSTNTASVTLTDSVSSTSTTTHSSTNSLGATSTSTNTNTASYSSSSSSSSSSTSIYTGTGTSQSSATTTSINWSTSTDVARFIGDGTIDPTAGLGIIPSAPTGLSFYRQYSGGTPAVYILWWSTGSCSTCWARLN